MVFCVDLACGATNRAKCEINLNSERRIRVSMGLAFAQMVGWIKRSGRPGLAQAVGRIQGPSPGCPALSLFCTLQVCATNVLPFMGLCHNILHVIRTWVYARMEHGASRTAPIDLSSA